MALNYFERFGSVTLPTLAAEHDLSTDETMPGLEILPHGAIDLYGEDVAPELPTTLTATGILYESALTTLQTTHDTLRALRGKRQKLYMRLPDDTIRWRYARFRHMQVRRETDRPYSLDVEIQFEAFPGGWRGEWHGPFLLDDGISLDSGFSLDSDDAVTLTASPYVYAVSNGGNHIVKNTTVTVTAGSADITSITVATGNVEWTYSGTITAGTALVVNCGNWSVQNNGSDDYDNLTLTANHGEQTWLPIQAGNNSVTVTFSGGSNDSVFQIDFNDRWN